MVRFIFKTFHAGCFQYEPQEVFMLKTRIGLKVGCDKRVMVELSKRAPLATDQSAIKARVARRAAQLSNCTRNLSAHKGARVLHAI